MYKKSDKDKEYTCLGFFKWKSREQCWLEHFLFPVKDQKYCDRSYCPFSFLFLLHERWAQTWDETILWLWAECQPDKYDNSSTSKCHTAQIEWIQFIMQSDRSFCVTMSLHLWHFVGMQLFINNTIDYELFWLQLYTGNSTSDSDAYFK